MRLYANVSPGSSMLRTAFSQRLLGGLAWVDRRLSALGASCCVGRSQAALQAQVGAKDNGSTAVAKNERTGDGVHATGESVRKRAPSTS